MHGRKATRAENNRNKKKKRFFEEIFCRKKKKSPIRYVWCIVDCRYLLVIRRRVWGDVVSDEAYYIRKKGASYKIIATVLRVVILPDVCLYRRAYLYKDSIHFLYPYIKN